MSVSLDFQDALREIRYQLVALTRENQELKRELADVRKLATEAQHASVSQRKAVTMQAIAAQDDERMRHLAITSTSPQEAELLRLMQPNEEMVVAQVNTPPEQVQALLANFRNSSAPLPAVRTETQEPTRKQRGKALYESMARNDERRVEQNAIAEHSTRMRERLRQQEVWQNSGRKFGLSEREWF